MSDDFNLTDVEIYELLLELDAMSQSSYIAACALCQLELLRTRYWKKPPVLQNTPTAHARHLSRPACSHPVVFSFWADVAALPCTGTKRLP